MPKVAYTVHEGIAAMITVSVVTHRHGAFIKRLAGELLRCPAVKRIVITVNVEEPLTLPGDARLTILRNPEPRGFGANHNAAFRHCTTPYFCVLNPDIELRGDPFPQLMQAFEPRAALVAPLVVSPAGELEDSYRKFPTVLDLVRKAVAPSRGTPAAREDLLRPDWVAGMFMLFRAEAFRSVGGFDEKYFLYYEDVDICARLRRQGRGISVCPAATVVHDAQRTSHRDLRYATWHARSMLRYFVKHGNGGRAVRAQPA